MQINVKYILRLLVLIIATAFGIFFLVSCILVYQGMQLDRSMDHAFETLEIPHKSFSGLTKHLGDFARYWGE